MSKNLLVLILFSTVIFLSGCATLQNPYNIIRRQKTEISQLKNELKENKEEFEVAQSKLMSKLKKQLQTHKVKIEKLKRGLVLTILEDVLFDSGKAKIKPEGKKTLKAITDILKEDCSENNISIEGHTDNVPIGHADWKSNWELSTARANIVLHFFIDECGVKPERLSATGFGKYRPTASNKTVEGRQQNRRVEIVILPEKIRGSGVES